MTGLTCDAGQVAQPGWPPQVVDWTEPHTSSALATRGKLADITDNRDSNRLARLDGATCERRTVKYHRR